MFADGCLASRGVLVAGERVKTDMNRDDFTKATPCIITGLPFRSMPSMSLPDKWTVVVIYALTNGPRRHGELVRLDRRNLS